MAKKSATTKKSTKAKKGAKAKKKAGRRRVSLHAVTKALIEAEKRVRAHDIPKADKARALKLLGKLRRELNVFCMQTATEPGSVAFVPMGVTC